jgi:hypothetical protein
MTELLSAIDLNLSLIVVCLPSLRPYLSLNTKSNYEPSDPPTKQSAASSRKKNPDETTFSVLDEPPSRSRSREVEQEKKGNGASDIELVNVHTLV